MTANRSYPIQREIGSVVRRPGTHIMCQAVLHEASNDLKVQDSDHDFLAPTEHVEMGRMMIDLMLDDLGCT